jgi:hypothetical protein
MANRFGAVLRNGVDAIRFGVNLIRFRCGFKQVAKGLGFARTRQRIGLNL